MKFLCISIYFSLSSLIESSLHEFWVYVHVVWFSIPILGLLLYMRHLDFVWKFWFLFEARNSSLFQVFWALISWLWSCFCKRGDSRFSRISDWFFTQTARAAWATARAAKQCFGYSSSIARAAWATTCAAKQSNYPILFSCRFLTSGPSFTRFSHVICIH